tara:strand:- start:120 stop:905 length:786 start_codon:yes stop_codon:yes gene_type:complete
MRDASVKSAQERESTIVGGLVVLMLVLWLGFLVHRSPTFPGSGLGHAIGIVGALLMLVPLAYLFVKRIPWLRKAVTSLVPMRTLLAWHIYAGILGPVLVLLHTGHHFESVLGAALAGLTIVVVLSGYVGRYLMRTINAGLKDKRSQLGQIEVAYEEIRNTLATSSMAPAVMARRGRLWRRIVDAFFVNDAGNDPVLTPIVTRAMRLAESRADLEYSIGTHERFKRWFAKWLRWHIALSMLLYLLMALHIWATIYFGIRWLS